MQEAKWQDQANQRLGVLTGQRTEINNQLAALRRTRNDLVEERVHAGPAQRTQIDARIAVIDERRVQLEKEQFRADDAIRAAMQEFAAGYPAPKGTENVTSQPAPPPFVPKTTADLTRMATFGAMLLAGFVVWLGIRRVFVRARPAGTVPEVSAQLKQLQVSIDAIAVEVERISEAQRYASKAMNKLGAGAAEFVPAPVKEGVVRQG